MEVRHVLKCAKGYYASNTGSRSCTKCSAGYYSNSGASSCSKCSDKFEHCVECSNSKCTKCEDGYEPSEDGQKCEKKGCPDKTIQVGNLCVTQYNPGNGGLPLNGVTIKLPGYSCTTTACCWQENTAISCNASKAPYSGCNRTVCTYQGASTACARLNYANLSWRLPTKTEAASFAAYNYGDKGLMLCGGGGSNYNLCAANWENKICKKRGNDGGCYPDWIWTSTAGYGSRYYGYYLEGNSWLSSDRGQVQAHGVRCVAPVPQDPDY